MFTKKDSGTKAVVVSEKLVPRVHVSQYRVRDLSDNLDRSHGNYLKFDLETLTALGLTQRKKVWIYNVSRVEFKLVHPILKGVTIPRRRDGEEYAVATSIPIAVPSPKENIDSGTIEFVLNDGRRVAQDLLNPNNLGLDQNFDKCNMAIGNNLNASGVFWSMNNPPRKSEIKAAVKRMEKRYTQLNLQVLMMSHLQPTELRGLSDEHREAFWYMNKKMKETQEKTQNVRK